MSNMQDPGNVNPPGGLPPAPKKTSPWVWVLGGCAVIVVIGTIVTSVALWWGYHKAKNYVNHEIDSNLGDMQTVDHLWSDVPQMDGTSVSKDDMPVPVKLLAGTILGHLGSLNKKGEDQSTGMINWILYTGTGSPDDLKAFYTPEKMAKKGWENGGNSCVSGSERGFPQVGALCVFEKDQDGKRVQLAIIGLEDNAKKNTNLFYLRLTPDQKSN